MVNIFYLFVVVAKILRKKQISCLFESEHVPIARFEALESRKSVGCQILPLNNGLRFLFQDAEVVVKKASKMRTITTKVRLKKFKFGREYLFIKQKDKPKKASRQITEEKKRNTAKIENFKKQRQVSSSEDAFKGKSKKSLISYLSQKYRLVALAVVVYILVVGSFVSIPVSLKHQKKQSFHEIKGHLVKISNQIYLF